MTLMQSDLWKQLVQCYTEKTQRCAPKTAAELGQTMAAAGDALQDIATLHEATLQQLAQKAPDLPLQKVAPEMSILLSEMLSGYDSQSRQQQTAASDRRASPTAEVQQAQQDLEAQHARLISLYRLGRTINATFEIDTIFELMAREAMLITSATHGAVLVVNKAEGVQYISQLLGFTPEEVAFAQKTPLVLGKGLIGYAYENQCIVVVDDVREDPRYWEFVPSTRAELVLPIIHGTTVLAHLDLQSPQVGAFRNVDLEYLKALADQAAIAIQNARLFQRAQLEIKERTRVQEDLERRAKQLLLVWQVSQQVSSLLEPEPLLKQIVELIRLTFKYAYVVILLVDDARTKLSLKAKSGFQMEASRTIELEIGVQGICGWVAAHGQPLLVNDVTRDPRYWQLRELTETRSEIAVPVKIKGQTIGVLDVQSASFNAFGEDDLFILEVLADQVGVTVENARLFSAEQQRRQEAETLRTAALSMITTVDRSRVIEQILIQLRKVVPYDSASVQLLKGQRLGDQRLGDQRLGDQRLEIIGGHGFPNLEELLGVTFDLTANNNPNCEVMRRRSTYIVQDAPAVYNEFLNTPHVKANIHSWLGAPLLIGNEPIGMIALDKHDPGFYTQEHARLAEAFAAQAAIAVANSQLFEAEREQRELAEALAQAAAAVTATLDLNEVLDRILEQVERIVTGDACNVMLIDGDYARAVRFRGYENPRSSSARAQSPMLIAETGTLRRMIKTGQPLVIPNTYEDPLWIVPESAERRWLCSYVGAPIRMGDKILGFLNVDAGQPGRFGPDDARRLALFAHHAASAIENARLYRELQDYASELERRVQERTAQIQAQLARLDAILNSTSDGIIVADMQGKILQANPIAQDWLSRTLAPDDANKLRESIQELSEHPNDHPHTLLALPGIDLQLTAAPISEPKPQRPSVVITIHDISQLKALERMKSSFVANVSHELRTPITTIKLYTELITRQPQKASLYMEMLAQSVEHLAHLVEKILQLAHIDAGRVELRLEATRLQDLAELIIGNHQVMARQSGVRLRLLPATQTIQVMADPKQLVEVLNNLVENGIQYTPGDGEITVSINTAEIEQRAWATVEIRDTGIGIPEDELPFVFERFFRGRIPQVMQKSGTGLGLAIVKEIAELHGGWTTIESKVNAGTTVTIYLPMSQPSSINPSRQA
ncbi:MAG: GAF domain-containing protein [Anaerolineae bacterium]|nr:GAF domain-containing protein [Anaerolineae bacterium]